MNTKIVMFASAVFLFSIGIILTFLPAEVLTYFSLESQKPTQLLCQLLGAQYFAFGMINWNIKSSLIGGIYNRPIAVSNFSHFFIGGLALIKGITSDANLPNILWPLTSVYLAFAVLFGLIMYKHPVKENKK